VLSLKHRSLLVLTSDKYPQTISVAGPVSCLIMYFSPERNRFGTQGRVRERLGGWREGWRV
jgi:hypothetical protein